MSRLSDRNTMTEARRYKTLTLGRAVGGGAGGAAMPQPTAQNQMLIADATPAWTLLAAPTAQYQVPITGADPYTPVWAALTLGDISDLTYAAPASPSVDLAASTEGSGAPLARADHTHQLDQSIAPTWTGVHTHAANVIFDDGAGDSPQLQFVGGSNDDTALMYLVDDATGGDSDLVIRLCAADTGSQLIIQDNSPATVAHIDADGNAVFQGHMNVGARDAVHSTTTILRVRETITALAGVYYGGNYLVTFAPAANFATTIQGNYARVTLDSSFARTGGTLTAFIGQVQVADGETPTAIRIRGMQALTDVEDAAATWAESLLINTPAVDTGSCVTGYGIRIAQGVVGAGSITTLYGVKIADITAGGTNYSIYTGTGLIHFGDQAEIIGSAAADVQLTVRGCAAQSANLQEWQNSTPTTLLSVPAAGGLTFSGATGTNVITVPDNLAQAVHLVDAGGIEYLRIISTDAQPVVVFNEGGADVDHRWEASGEANALFVQGSDGKIGIWTTTLNAARIEIGGAAGPAIVNLPTNLATIDAGLSTRDVADESIVMFGTNLRANYTGRVVAAKAGACIRCDTRDQDGGTTPGNYYTVFHVLTKAADAAEGIYTVPFQIAAGAPTGSLIVSRSGAVGLGIVPLHNLHAFSSGHTELKIESDTDNAILYLDCPADEYSYIEWQTAGVRDWQLIRPANQTYLDLTDAAATVMRWAQDGTVTIPDLAGVGDVFADGNGKLIADPSDRKLKDNIQSLTGGLDVVRQLRGVTYDWKSEELAKVGLDFGECGQQIGLIAQEVVEVVPQARSDGKKYGSYRKDAITPYLIEAIKELDTRLTQLEVQ